MKIPEADSIAPSSRSSERSGSSTSTHYSSDAPTPTNSPPSTPTGNTFTTGPNPRPTSTGTTFSTAPFSPRSSAALHTLNIRFSGDRGHPVHPRHFLKEFNIAMRDMGVFGDRQKIEAFGDYLVVDSPAEWWYFERMGVSMIPGEEPEAMSWKMFQDEFVARFPPDGKYDPQAVELQKIKSAKFRQTAAVSARIIVRWIEEASPQEGPGLSSPQEGHNTSTHREEGVTGTVKTVKLGGYKPIATEETFSLSDYEVPEGAKVQFLSRVWGVGEYNSVEDVWFIHDPKSTKGADFRQSGTAFKGWFNYTGKYEM